ncbi:uncharacterized protein RSE6_04675 [Rhynchosporium secalis]|uniref:Uncharacterized protein n=1 Tax=Rhynchosporium secalis TaxID=38038 RepID=A0A1E1M5Z1_RHYSE|nr:uncharacterized protein RSE6_04675 [Rhynchosporium secalis]
MRSNSPNGESSGETSLPHHLPESLMDLSSEMVLQMLEVYIPESPEGMDAAELGNSNLTIASTVREVGNRLANAKYHIEKPNPKSILRLTAIEATAFFETVCSQNQSLKKVQIDAAVQEGFIEMQTQVIAGLEQYSARLERNVEKLIWVAGAKTFSVYGQLAEHPTLPQEDFALLQAKFETVTHKCELLQSRAKLIQAINTGALGYVDYLTNSISTEMQGIPTLVDIYISDVDKFLLEKERVAISDQYDFQIYRDSLESHLHLRTKRDWEFVELLWTTLKAKLGSEAAEKLIVSFFVPLDNFASFVAGFEPHLLIEKLSVLKSETGETLPEEMDSMPTRFAEGIRDLRLSEAFNGILKMGYLPQASDATPSALECDKELLVDGKVTPDVWSKEHKVVLKAWQQTVALLRKTQTRAWGIRNEYILHIDKCKISTWINELFDLAFGLETSRTGLSLNEKIGQTKARVTLLLANNAKHERKESRQEGVESGHEAQHSSKFGNSSTTSTEVRCKYYQSRQQLLRKAVREAQGDPAPSRSRKS